mmetsp:Transcript_10011/g.1566  ORF Transcript_10011/g.1566 Transcript_10011/m.1566 type:complete len:129 (+) Transcript_10011:48-434(+)
MCCIPMCFLKFWMLIGGTIHFVIGLVLVIFSFIFKGNADDYLPESYDDNIKTGSLGILLLGIFIMLSGFLGIVGGWKKIKICVCIFVIVTIVFFITIFAFAIIATVGKGKLKDYIGTEKSCMDYLENE